MENSSPKSETVSRRIQFKLGTRIEHASGITWRLQGQKVRFWVKVNVTYRIPLKIAITQ